MPLNTTQSTVLRPAIGPPVTLGRITLAFVEVLLLGFWLGAMGFFGFAVAPSAFDVLGSRHLAGTLVTSVLSKADLAGLILGPVLMVLVVVTWRMDKTRKAGNITRLVLLGVMTAAAATSRFFVTPILVSIRNSMGDLIENVAETDPLRIQFNDLHHYSVGMMSVAIFAGLVALFFTVYQWFKR